MWYLDLLVVVGHCQLRAISGPAVGRDRRHSERRNARHRHGFGSRTLVSLHEPVAEARVVWMGPLSVTSASSGRQVGGGWKSLPTSLPDEKTKVLPKLAIKAP